MLGRGTHHKAYGLWLRGNTCFYDTFARRASVCLQSHLSHIWEILEVSVEQMTLSFLCSFPPVFKDFRVSPSGN